MNADPIFDWFVDSWMHCSGELLLVLCNRFQNNNMLCNPKFNLRLLYGRPSVLYLKLVSIFIVPFYFMSIVLSCNVVTYHCIYHALRVMVKSLSY